MERKKSAREWEGKEKKAKTMTSYKECYVVSSAGADVHCFTTLRSPQQHSPPSISTLLLINNSLTRQKQEREFYFALMRKRRTLNFSA